jgi:S-layer protein
VTSSAAILDGGDGTDTLSMTAASADGLDGSTVFSAQVKNFERLTINNAYGTDNDTLDTLTLNLANLGFTTYVTTTGTVADTTNVTNSDVLVLDKLATNGTVVLAGKGLITVNVADAATGTSDILNVTNTVANGGTLTAANVETIKLTQSTANGALVVTAADATAMTITASKTLSLTLTGSTKLTSIDGSASTAAITVTSLNTTSATTIQGGSGDDVLKAATGSTADVLIGGAGADSLYANAGLSTLTGGAGFDTFYITTNSTNVNSYATITDATKGDYIVFNATGGTEAFKSAAVTLGDTAVFQDYANAAINTLALGEIGWFQFGGNTYIVQDGDTGGGADTTTFTNGEDYIVKLTGLIDLSLASFDTAEYAIRIG